MGSGVHCAGECHGSIGLIPLQVEATAPVKRVWRHCFVGIFFSVGITAFCQLGTCSSFLFFCPCCVMCWHSFRSFVVWHATFLWALALLGKSHACLRLFCC